MRKDIFASILSKGIWILEKSPRQGKKYLMLSITSSEQI